MNIDFSQPQHQSQKGIIVLAIISYGKILKGFWFIILYFIYKQREQALWILPLVAVVVLLYVFIEAYIRYQYFTYHLDFENDEFIIKNGVFNKKTIHLEKNKIQEVNINQPFFHRFLSIYQLEIDSPGTDKKEITINAISYDNAEFIRSYLLENQNESVKVEDVRSENSGQLKISAASLLKYAVTANYLKSFLALISLLLYLSQQILDNLNLDINEYLEGENAYENFAALSIFTIVISFLLLAIVGILINVIRTFILYYNLKITKARENLSMEYGLFNKKNHIINNKKIQIFSSTQNFFQKKWKVLHLKFNQIGEENSKNSTSNIPGCNTEEKNEILQFLYGEVPAFTKYLKINYRYLISRGTIFIILPLIVGYIVMSDRYTFLFYSIIYSIFAAILIYFSFRNNKFYYSTHFACKQAGIWDVEQKTIELEKIQTIKISQYFWQKRTGLGNITISTAGGSLRMNIAKIKDLNILANYCLYKVQSSLKNWM